MLAPLRPIDIVGASIRSCIPAISCALHLYRWRSCHIFTKATIRHYRDVTPLWTAQLGIRCFSTRSPRYRSNGEHSRRSSPGYSRQRDHQREEPRAVCQSGRGLSEKSLIDDEAELSDWVGNLKEDSFRSGLNSDSEDSDEESVRQKMDRRGGRDHARNAWERDAFSYGKDKKSRRERFPSSMTTRHRDSEDYSDSNNRRAAGVPDIRFSKPRKQFKSGADDSKGVDSDSFSGYGNVQARGDVSEVGNRVSALGFEKWDRCRDLVRDKKDSRRQSLPVLDSDDSEENEAVLFGSDEEEAGEGKDGLELDMRKGVDSSSSPTEEDVSPCLPRSASGKQNHYLSNTKFDQYSISPLSLKGLQAAGYDKMTVVQEATLPAILRGKDLLAKAKTGTGKTVAFLLPAIEVVARLSPSGCDSRRSPVNVLVVCPTRELANQAAAEANTLLKFHPEIGVQVVIGGTRLALEQKRMQTNPCQILVATPGRLRDHIENTPGFATRLTNVKVLVLDEADHLLDMGFRKDIENIIAALPKQRQTLLFSATVPEEVRQICHIALKRDHEFINTNEEGTEETHSQVEQMLLVATLDKHFSLLYNTLKEHILSDADYKVVVFCTTAMVTSLVADLLSELNMNVREIHSRKTQSYRTRISDEFRKSKHLILVTSDVSARGVDYPDVTLVVQLGLPSDREQYIHRLGRTGRKGKDGKGLLLLAPWEDFFLSCIRDLPIKRIPLPLVDPDMRKMVDKALLHVELKKKESAYQAWLGYYNSKKNIAHDKCRLVELANEFSRCMGLDDPPAIPKLVLGKMGLKNVPGLRIR